MPTDCDWANESPLGQRIVTGQVGDLTLADSTLADWTRRARGWIVTPPKF